VAVLADARTTAHNGSAVNNGAVTNLDIGIDGHKRTDFHVVPDFSVRVDDGILMNIHILFLVAVFDFLFT
jgi:hypothetical protein